MRAIHAYILSGIIGLGLLGCDDVHSPDHNQVAISDKVFLLPSDKSNFGWSFSKKYGWLEFNLDVRNYAPVAYISETEKENLVTVRMGPLDTMDKGYYWTSKDTVFQRKTKLCKNYKLDNDDVEFCDRGFSGKDSAAPHVYTITNENKNYKTVLECTDRVNLPNSMCHARTRFLDNLQINYGFNVSHLDKSVEINQAVREFVTKMRLESKAS